MAMDPSPYAAPDELGLAQQELWYRIALEYEPPAAHMARLIGATANHLRLLEQPAVETILYPDVFSPQLVELKAALEAGISVLAEYLWAIGGEPDPDREKAEHIARQMVQEFLDAWITDNKGQED